MVRLDLVVIETAPKIRGSVSFNVLRKDLIVAYRHIAKSGCVHIVVSRISCSLPVQMCVDVHRNAVVELYWVDWNVT